MNHKHLINNSIITNMVSKKRIPLLISTLFIFTILSSCSYASADDQDLARQYAPEFYFEAAERCFPTNAQYQIDTSYLYQYPNQLIQENPTSEQLGNLSSQTYSIYYLDNQKGSTNDDAIINDYHNTMQTLGYIVYYRVFSSSNEKVIQYWMYYAFNKGDLNQHEGDWEMVQIYLSQDTPTHVMYSQHESGQKATWQQVEKTNDHIKVYVARGSHANYLRSYSGKLGVASDIVGSNGIVLQSSEYQLDSLTDQTWLPFAGRWGEMNSIQDTFLGKSGPYGPMYRQDGQMWNTPNTWGMNLPAADNNIFIVELLLYHFLTIFIVITALTLVLIFVRLRKQYKKTGFGPRILSFLYIDGLNLKSIGNLLFIGGIIIAIIAVFSPWYTISANISTSEYSTQGFVNYFMIDGVNGIQINFPGSNGPIPIGTLALPFGVFIAVGIIFTLIKTIGVHESKILGKKYLYQGIRFLIPFILLIVGVVIIGNMFSSFVPEGISQTSIIPIFSSLSSSPFGGSELVTLTESGVTGTINMHWGFGTGGLLFILAGILLIIAGFCERSARTALFAGNQKNIMDHKEKPSQ